MKFLTLIPIIGLAATLSACGHYYSYNDNGHRYSSNHPLAQPYVSAGREEAVTPESAGIVHSYISALDEAKADMQVEAIIPLEQEQGDARGFSLWVPSEGGLGSGFVFSGALQRKRLEDALETTPPGGEVRWKAGVQNFLFKPNSPIYQPHYSGGRCRDAVVLVTGGAQQHKTRGLFCQRAPGASWVMISALTPSF